MLNFICGTEETKKLNEIYRRAQADAALGKSVFILVPEQYSMYAEQELISTLGLSSQSKIQVLTFSRLCNLIFSKMGPLRTGYIDKAGKHIMTRRALQLSAKKLTCFRRNLSQNGFTGLIQSAISEFKRYGVLPSALKAAAEKTTDEKLSMKLRDLSEIYECFNQLLAEGHANSEDNLSLIIPKIQKADFLRGSFYINFFKSFTPTEYAALSQLMTVADVCVALTTDKIEGQDAVFSSQINTYQKLTKAAAEKHVEFLPPYFIPLSDDSSAHTDLCHLKENFFSCSPEVYNNAPEHIHLVRPDNYHAEVTLCARLIRRLMREEGYSFNDILILTGSMESYELLIPQIFEEYGINYFLDRKIPLTESPLMRMLLSVLEILTFGFSYDRIMRVARSGFFPVSIRETDSFENYILAADIPKSLWNTRADWTYNPDKHAFNMKYINSVKAKLIHPILDLADMFSGRKTAKTICQNLFTWMNSISLPEAVSKKIAYLKHRGELRSAEHLRMVWNSFVSVTNQISDYMNDEYSTFAEFFELFSAACGELSVGTVPLTRDKVVISPVDLFRSTGVKAVIILGALDGVFPRDYMSEGLISDAERIMLEEAGLTLAPDTFTQQKEEQFLIYSVLTTPKEHLYVFAPLSDRDGSGLKPSEILHTLKGSLFPQLQDEAAILSSEHSITESREAAFRVLSSQLFENGWNEHQLSPLWEAVLTCLNADPQYSHRLSALRKMHEAKSADTALTPEIAKKLYGLPLTLSVSKLEKYNGCAFSFFMRYGLVARERLMGGLNPSDTGNILHEILCDYFKAKSGQNADYSKISRDQCFGEISALVDEVSKTANENLYAESHYYKYMMMRMKSIATSTAWKLINFYAQSTFRPAGFEIGFGDGKTYPPYELDSSEGKVYLEGFVDRMDSAQIDGTPSLAITDYKSSKRNLDMALAAAGIHFQPLIYANALRKHIPKSQVAAMFYLHMNDPLIGFSDTPDDFTLEKQINDGISAQGIIMNEPSVIQSIDTHHGDDSSIHYIACTPGSLLDKADLEKALDDADKKASETAENILSGRIDINPAFISGFDPCEYCPYGSICSSK